MNLYAEIKRLVDKETMEDIISIENIILETKVRIDNGEYFKGWELRDHSNLKVKLSSLKGQRAFKLVSLYKEALKDKYLPNEPLEVAESVYLQASRFSQSMESIENSYATFVELESVKGCKNENIS